MDKKRKLTDNPLLDKMSKNLTTSSVGALSLSSNLLTGPSTSSLLTKGHTKTQSGISGSSLLSSGSLSLSTNLSLKSNVNLTPSFSSLGSSSLTSSPLLSTTFLTSSKVGGSVDTNKASTGGKTSNIESGFLNLSLQGVKKESSAAESKKAVSKEKTVRLNVSGVQGRKRGIVKSEKMEKKKKVESKDGVVTAEVMKRHAIDSPEYTIKCENVDLMEDYMEVDLPKFIPPTSDMRLVHKIGKSLTDVVAIKRGLINCVSGSLISQPNFKNRSDPMRQQITENVNVVIDYDPEFILKVALYSRKELNIRTTSNFLLALASSSYSCRPYLKKYFCASIALPTDWIEVAEIVQTLENNNLKLGSIPAALRRVMITKFPEFDQYQLAKYNKDSSGKKKKAKAKKLQDAKKKAEKKEKKRGLFDSDSSDSEEEGEEKRPFRQLSSVSYDEKESEEELRKQRFTIKQLIRKLHLREPVEHIMSIIGKRYPATLEEFYKSRLPGTFNEEKAGKRMKLPVPETWETQVSLKGNKASTWEDLIDHKKLPFMAMLRNLRNLIKAGISPKHHNFVIRRLSDQRAVLNSKQFPFRFFSAYVVLQELEEAYDQNQKDLIETAENQAMAGGINPSAPPSRGGIRGRGRGRGGIQRGRITKIPMRGRRTRVGTLGGPKEFPWWVLKKMKKDEQNNIVKEVPYDKALLQRYRKALDTSVKIATVHNVQPIKGHTILLCDIGAGMFQACSSAKGLGKPRTLREISTLMGLMCKHACEECEFLVYHDTSFMTVELKKGTILDNMSTILDEDIIGDKSDAMVSGIPYAVLFEKLRDKIQIDNLLVFGEDFYPHTPKGKVLNNFLKAYRHSVNPNLLFVGVTFSSPRPGFTMGVTPEHENDIYISGYSDAILRFIAERGDSGQVQHVDKIDDAFSLRPMPKVKLPVEVLDKDLTVKPQAGLQLTAPAPRWRTVRVFISSPFRDMHGERDLLTRFVFPELRSITRKRFINVYEVDLRWGITEEETKSNRTLDVCLEEVSRCQIFVGILGERYGWTLDSYDVPNTEEFDWVRNYPPHASVTELEMYAGALSKPGDVRDTAFFFLRDNTFEKDIPSAFANDFRAEHETAQVKIDGLKRVIRKSGLDVYDSYPCRWGGCVGNKPMVSGLEDFGARMLNTLLNAVKKLCPEEDEVLTEEVHVDNLHWSMVEKYSADHIGRDVLKKQIIDKITSTAFGVIGLVGKAGSGKSALMASVITKYASMKQSGDGYSLLVHMAGAAPGSINMAATVRRLASQLNTKFGLGYTLPEDFKNLTMTFADLLSEAGAICMTRLVIFLDGLDGMENTNQPFSLEWLPARIPDNVVFVLTALDGEKTHKSLTRIGATEISVGNLDMWDKAQIVRDTLGKHRKTLNESGFGNQMKLLMLKKDAHNPLYLKLACEELRVFGVFEKIVDKLKSLPHTTTQMLQEILNRLEEDHGKEIVSIALSLLACVRDGLYPEELYELLNWYYILNGKVTKPLDFYNVNPDLFDKIPPLAFSYLARSIMSFLNPSSTWAPVLSLANAEICTAVRLRYLKGSADSLELTLHKLLAGFFWRQADAEKDGLWKGQQGRAFSELPFHLASAGCYNELEEILCSLKFIQVKCNLGLAAKLLDDFSPKECQSKLIAKEQAKFLALPRVQQYKSYISRNIEILVNFPSLAWQQAINEPVHTQPCTDAGLSRLRKQDHSPYMEWLDRPESESQCYLTLSNFKNHATCIAVAPSGSYFATGSFDCLVRIYDMNTGQEAKFFSGHSDAVTDVCFVNNNTLCSASADQTLCLWDIANGHRLHTLKGHSRRVNACAADPKGQLVASGGWDSIVNLWKVSDGSKQSSFTIDSPVNSVDFHPTDDLIVVGSWDSLIRIYSSLHQTRVAILRGHSTSVRDIAYNSTGTHLASAALDGDVKLWDAIKGSQVGTVKGHVGPINKLIFSPTGRELVTAGDDHQIKVWSGDLGIPVQCINASNIGPVTSVAICPEGASLIVGFHTGLVRLYNIATGVNLFEVKICASPIRAVSFSKNGSYILVGCDDAYVQILESTQGSRVCKLIGHSQPVLCVGVGKECVTSGGEDFTCCVYSSIKDLKSSRQSNPVAVLKHHIAPVTSCSLNVTEDLLATASRDSNVAIYDVREIFINPSASPKQVLSNCHADWINSCQWSNLANFLITASNDFNLKLWDVKTSNEKLTLKGHSSAVNTVAFKSGCIVSGSSDGIVKVWSHKGIEITTLRGHSLRVNACDIYVSCKEAEVMESKTLNWAEDEDADTSKKEKKGKTGNMKDVLVVSGADDGNIWIWKPLQAYSLATLTGHSNRVLSVGMDKENHVASCSLDRSVRLWKPQMKDEINRTTHEAPITFLAVSAKKTTIVSGSRDGMLKIWKFSANSLTVQMVVSIQAHESSVNCGCFMGSSDTRFITGGDDNQVIRWEISERKSGTCVRKDNVFHCEMPITSVVCGNDLGKFVYTTWKGDVFVYTPQKGEQKLISLKKENYAKPGLDAIDIWCTSISLHAENTGIQEFLLGRADSYITFLGLLSDYTNIAKLNNFEIRRDQTEVVQYPRPNWIHCVTSVGKTVFAGDSSGQVSITSSDGIWTEKVHTSAVTSIVIVGSTVLTSSLDSTIKVWTFEENNPVKLLQVGQFFNPAPITSLKTLTSAAKDSDIYVIAGDQLGNMHRFIWHNF